MGLTVRRLRPGEWQMLRDVRLRALRDAPAAFGSTFEAEVVREDEWWIASVHRITWLVAVDGGQVAGLLGALPPGMDISHREIISMWVAPQRRGRGLGTSLVSAAKDLARAERATALTLRVAEHNLRARQFYERLGFVLTGDAEPLRRDPAAQSLEMRLDLHPKPAGADRDAG